MRSIGLAGTLYSSTEAVFVLMGLLCSGSRPGHPRAEQLKTVIRQRLKVGCAF